MAIQNRRGVYNNFTPSKMVPGEFAVVQSGDPNGKDGKAVYIAFGTGDARRLATADDIKQEVDASTESIADALVQQFEDSVADDLEAAQTAATNASESAQAASASAEEAAESVENVTNALTSAFYTGEVSGSIASFADGAENIPMKSVVVDIEPVQSGTGDPSPDNVRPISGWTGVKVTRCGKNLYNSFSQSTSGNGITFTANDDGTITVDGTATANASKTLDIQHLKAGSYIVNGCPVGGSSSQYELRVIINNAIVARDYGSGVNLTLDEDSDVLLRVFIYNGTTISSQIFKPMIRRASDTDSTYEPYQGETYDINFPSEAGTVYGGMLDVTTGELTVNWTKIDLGTLTWNNADPVLETGFAGRANVTGRKFGMDSDGIIGFCDSYSFWGNSSTSIISRSIQNEQFAYQITNAFIWLRDDSCTTVEELKAKLSGVYLVYEMRTPQTYHFTPTEVTTLLGENNVWADTGDIDVAYCADPTLLLDDKLSEVQNIKSMIAGVESSAVATKNYSIGDLVIVGDTLCEVTVAITSGETISASNAEVTTVDNAIKNKIADSIDNTLTQTGKAADAKKVGDELTSLKGDLENKVYPEIYKWGNLAPLTPAESNKTNNYYLTGLGGCVYDTQSGVMLVTYSVTPGEYIKLSLSNDTQGTYQWQNNKTIPVGDSNPYLVETPVTGAVDDIVIVPDGATYLIVSQLQSNSTNKVEIRDSRLDNIKSGIDSIVVEEEITITDHEQGKYINKTGGVSNYAGVAAYSTLIPVNKGDIITARLYANPFMTAIAYVTADYVFKRPAVLGDTYAVKEYTLVSEHTGWICLSYFIAYNHTCTIKRNIPVEANDRETLKGKFLLWCGDSIMRGNTWNDANDGWAGRVADRTGCRFKNYGVGGSTICNNVPNGATPTIYTQIETAHTEYPDADYIIFDGGCNDADLIGSIIGGTTPAQFGSFSPTDWSGNYDTDTFCGSLETICMHLSQYWLGKHVGYIVPQKQGVTNDYSATGNNRRAYYETAIQICKKWGIAVLNLWDDCYMNPKHTWMCDTDSTMTAQEIYDAGFLYADRQHLTAAGYDYQGAIVAEWIKGL